MLELIDTTNNIICDISQDIRAFNEGRERIEEMDIEVNHPKNFSTLWLNDILSVESFNIMDKCEDKEKEPYIDIDLDVEKPSVIYQPTEPTMRDDAKIVEMVIESKEETKQISYEDCSPI